MEFTQLKIVHMEELNAYHSFLASINYEGDMNALCRIPNNDTLNHLKKIITSELLCTIVY